MSGRVHRQPVMAQTKRSSRTEVRNLEVFKRGANRLHNVLGELHWWGTWWCNRYNE